MVQLPQHTNHQRETFFNYILLAPPSYCKDLLLLSLSDVTPGDQYFRWTGTRTEYLESTCFRRMCTEGSGLPINRTAAANHSIIHSIPREKPEEWPPCLIHRLKKKQRERWWVLNDNFQTSNDPSSLMTRYISFIQTKQIKFNDIDLNTRLRSSCYPPANTVPLSGQIESLVESAQCVLCRVIKTLCSVLSCATHIHTHTYARTHTHIHTHTHTHASTRAQTYMHTQTHASTCAHTRTHTHTHTCKDARTHTYTHTHMRTRTCTHAHTHKHM